MLNPPFADWIKQLQCHNQNWRIQAKKQGRGMPRP